MLTIIYNKTGGFVSCKHAIKNLLTDCAVSVYVAVCDVSTTRSICVNTPRIGM